MNYKAAMENVAAIIKYLQKHGIDPILYGSTGVSLYLGNFKQFNDTDLLIQGKWLQGEGWANLQKLMGAAGFRLVDEHEHEFEGSAGKVAFAEETVLTRDKILASLGELTTMQVGSLTVRTLTPEQFMAAYSFSVKDGYRLETRGKKDRTIISLLETYLAKLDRNEV